MSWFLRTAAAVCLAWSIVLTVGRHWLTTTEQQTALAQAMAHGQGASLLVLAFLYWRAAGEKTPNTTVIVGAVLFLLLRVTTDLYDLLVLVDAMNGMISLADLVICFTLAIGMIEMLPRTLGGAKEKGAGDR